MPRFESGWARVGWVAAGGLGLLALWYGLRLSGLVSPFVLPWPHGVLAEGWRLRGEVFPAAGRTFTAALLGLLLAVGGGFGLALLLASARWVQRAFYPWVLVLQMTPVIILVPLIGLWMGGGLPAILVVSFLIGFFPVVASTTFGLISVEPGLRELFRLNRASRLQELLHLRSTHALPHFLTGAKIAATLAPIGAIAGDFLLGTSRFAGLGFLVQIYRRQFELEGIFALAAVACLLGFAFVGSVQLLTWALLRRWHPSMQ